MPVRSESGQQHHLAAWLQFPRRLALLLLAYAAALALLQALRQPLLNTLQRPASERIPANLITQRVENTALLLAVGLALALLGALLISPVAILVHKVEAARGPPGSILKGLGRLVFFGPASAPVFCLGLFLILLFSQRLRLLPAVGMIDPGDPGNLGSRIAHLILPALTLAVLPGIVTAQVVAREVTLSRAGGEKHPWRIGLLRGLGTAAGQVAGLLTATVLVEDLFAWPGMGKLLVDAASHREIPVLLEILPVYMQITLVGRVTAELCHWGERLQRGSGVPRPPEPTAWRMRARGVYVVLALLLLLLPLGLVVAGMTVDQQAALRTDVGARLAPPSREHPWGTDQIGRDLRARVLWGAALSLGAAGVAATLTLLPGILVGALTGSLAAQGQLWTESLADLLLLPADVLLLIPTLPGAILIGQLTWASSDGSSGGGLPLWAVWVLAILLLPRAIRTYHALWLAVPEQHPRSRLALAGLGALLLGTLFLGFGLLAGLDFLGLGIQPPLPTLGGVLKAALLALQQSRRGAIMAGAVLWTCAYAFYTSTDALLGYFHSKAPLAQLNQ